MPVSLAALAAPTVRRSLEWNGETVAFTYRPAAHTASFTSRVIAAEKANDPLELAALLAELVTWIDVVDETGVVLECTGTVFAERLPFPFLAALWKSVGEAATPDPQKGETSAAG